MEPRDVRTNLFETVQFILRLSCQSQPPALIFAGSKTEHRMGQEKIINEDYQTNPQTFMMLVN